MKKAIAMACGLVLLLGLFAGCAAKAEPEQEEALNAAQTEALYALAAELTEYISGGDEASALAMMDEAMQKAMEGQLAEIWQGFVESLGDFSETGAYLGLKQGDYEILEMTLVFAGGSLIQRTVFDGEGKVAGLFFREGTVAGAVELSPLPETVEEISVVVDAGEGYPLAGSLTLPKNEEPLAALVLIHGSGPSDKNETIGPNTPLRDLAIGLAERGFAVLRYDKRTYSYAAELSQDPELPKLTVDEELANDAVAAVRLLSEREEIDPDKIFLLGHSLGGGLLSYIDALGADSAGYIIMAGTSRPLWELSADQNLLLADELKLSDEKQKAQALRDVVTEELKKAEKLAGLTDEEALDEQNTVFGLSAWYMRKFTQIDASALHMQDKKPVLVLQGEKDRQVGMNDFQLWKEKLKGHPEARFISYPQLNHLFGAYEGEMLPFSQLVSVEYAQRTPVAQEVLDDIAHWLLDR